MTPRKPTGNPPGRRPSEDPAAVRRNVRSARFTDAQAVAIDATPGGLHAIVVKHLGESEPTTDTPAAP